MESTEFQHFYPANTNKIFKKYNKKIVPWKNGEQELCENENTPTLNKRLLLNLTIGIILKALIKLYYRKMLIESIHGLSKSVLIILINI